MQTFLTSYQGGFSNLLSWDDFDAFWARLGATDTLWFVYAPNRDVRPPAEPLTRGAFLDFLQESALFLKTTHTENYCGIVYVDNKNMPTMIKIYHPKRLGAVCGSSATPVLPEWVLSTLPPSDLRPALAVGARPFWAFWQRS